MWRSQVGEVYLPEGNDETATEVEADGVPKKPSAVGWERNPQGKLGARMADLGPMMDPER